MTPAMRARLQAASDMVLEQIGNGAQPGEVIDKLVAVHGATYKTDASTNSLRCAGVNATCTWSRTEGLLNAWRRLATIKLATSQP